MAKIQQSVEINVPINVAYNQLTQFTDFPRFMDGVQEIKQLDDTHLHWHTRSDGQEKEWDSEITEQVPDQCIAWRNLNGKKNVGMVMLQPVAEDKTVVTISMECDPEGISPEVQAVEAKISQHTEQDLIRFKQFIENLGHETGQWRGEVHDSQVTKSGDSHQWATQQGNQSSMQTSAMQQTAPLESQQATLADQASQQLNQQVSELTAQWPQQAVDQEQAQAQASPEQQQIDQQTQPRENVSPQHQTSEKPQIRRDAASSSQQNGTESWLPKLMDVWEEPLVVMRRMSQEMDNLFERFIGRPLGMPLLSQGGSRNWTPPVEISRRDNLMIILADLPGITREDVQVEIKGDKLTIEGDRHVQAQGSAQEYRRTERAYGHFYRAIPLPEGVDPDSAQASMHDGVLEIILPVIPQEKPGRRLDIQSR